MTTQLEELFGMLLGAAGQAEKAIAQADIGRQLDRLTLFLRVRRGEAVIKPALGESVVYVREHGGTASTGRSFARVPTAAAGATQLGRYSSLSV